MKPNFHAGHVSIEDMGEYVLIGFADNEHETQDYLMLQRAYEFEEQDRELGMADVYIERNDQGYSGYGRIERFDLQPDRIRVRFDDHGTRSMAGICEMEVTFEESRFEELRAALQQCFEGFPYYSEKVGLE